MPHCSYTETASCYTNPSEVSFIRVSVGGPAVDDQPDNNSEKDEGTERDLMMPPIKEVLLFIPSLCSTLNAKNLLQIEDPEI